jgi:cytochrome P450
MADPKTRPVAGVKEVDFNSGEFQQTFKQVYTEMHASGCPFAHSTPGDHYAVASHKAISEALVQPKLWRSKYGPGLLYQPEDAPGVLVSVDPPEHTFEAKVASKAFSKAYFDSFIPAIEAFVDEKIDSFHAAGTVDIHKALSEALPLFVIFEMFGIPIGDRTELFRQEIKNGVTRMLEPGDMRDYVPAEETRPYSQKMFREHLEICKRKLETGEFEPGQNLVTRFLTSTADNGQRLSDEKILGFCSFLLAAGSATTTILLSNLLYRLLSEPEELAKLRADPELLPLAIEEALRIDAPVQGLFRTNDEETTLGPIHLEKDTKVMMLWAAGNLDPAVFDDPLKFSLDRDINLVRKHLAFGYGIHICRGSPLARLEAKIFLEAVLRRLPNLRIAGEVKPELSMPVLQGIAEFPVAWDVV